MLCSMLFNTNNNSTEYLCSYSLLALLGLLGGCRDIQREHSADSRTPEARYFNPKKLSDFIAQKRGNITY